MSNSRLTQAAKDALSGRRIQDVDDKCIFLDNGVCIYLEDDEIEHLNADNDDE